MAKVPETKPSGESGVRYEVSGLYKGRDLYTMRDKQHVNVTGEAVERNARARKNKSAHKYTYRKGTEDDRKWYYELNFLRDPLGNLILDANNQPISKQKAIVKITNGATNVNDGSESDSSDK